MVREHDGLRWHRCVRCDAWVPLLAPTAPTRTHLPERADIALPLRGRPLRDRYVLRLIALDRLVHFLVLALAVAVFVFIADRGVISGPFYRVLDAVQGAIGGPNGAGSTGLLDELRSAFAVKAGTLWLVALALAGYAVLELVEAVGLWTARHWAEYLTFVATALLLIPDVYELTETISATKIVTVVINLAVLAYLLFARRLFGIRGGAAEAAEHRRASGWPALERTLPHPAAAPAS